MSVIYFGDRAPAVSGIEVIVPAAACGMHPPMLAERIPGMKEACKQEYDYHQTK
jgi:hypothetical protein